MKDLKVVVYLDDLLIVSKDEQEHLATLCKVLQRLQDSGLKGAVVGQSWPNG